MVDDAGFASLLRQGAVTHRVGAIHIIDSLEDPEPRTARAVYRELQQTLEATGISITAHYWEEPTKAGFLRCLDDIAQETRTSGIAPIVQLETHGDRANGLWLPRGAWISWEELRSPLTEINLQSRLNLFVLVNACDGEGLTHVLQLTHRAPLWGLIGPNRRVSPAELEAASVAFYRTFLSTRNGDAAVAAMNASVTAGNSPFAVINAQFMFRAVMRHYLTELCSDASLAARIERLLQDERLRDAPAKVKAAMKSGLEQRLTDHAGLFGAVKRHFFFEDLIPENALRFKVTLDDCLVPRRGVASALRPLSDHSRRRR